MFPEPIFADRADAGRQLAAQLADFANRPNAIVLGIPRGGVVIAAEIAYALNLPLDIFLSHKLGVPGHEELAFGAIAANGSRYLDPRAIRHAQISPETVERVTAEVQQLLDQRASLYRGNRPPLTLANRTVLLVDDGIATGASAYAAIQALRQIQPRGNRPRRPRGPRLHRRLAPKIRRAPRLPPRSQRLLRSRPVFPILRPTPRRRDHPPPEFTQPINVKAGSTRRPTAEGGRDRPGFGAIHGKPLILKVVSASSPKGCRHRLDKPVRAGPSLAVRNPPKDVVLTKNDEQGEIP